MFLNTHVYVIYKVDLFVNKAFSSFGIKKNNCCDDWIFTKEILLITVKY